MSLPPIIHQVWLGPNPIPAQHVEFATTWKGLAAEKFVLWTDRPGEHEGPWDVQQGLPPGPMSCYSSAFRDHARGREVYALLSDVFRAQVLWEFGGLYVDLDCFATGIPGLWDYFGDRHLTVSEECNGTRVGNFLMAAPRRHPALTAMMRDQRQRLVDAHHAGRQVFPISDTGPECIARQLHRSDIEVLPWRIFSPYDGYYEFPAGDWWKRYEWPVESVGCHVYASGWGHDKRKTNPITEHELMVERKPLKPALLQSHWAEGDRKEALR